MLRRSIRRHPRAWLLTLAPLLLALETACVGVVALDSGQTKITPKEAAKFLKEGDKTVKAYRGGVEVDASKALGASFARAAAAAELYVYGNYTGRVRMTPPKGNRALRGFTRGTLIAGARLGYASPTSDDAVGRATVRVKFSTRGTGSLCVRLAWRATAAQQKIKGTWTALGGTGRAARLHDKGTFRGIQPKPFVPKGTVALSGKASLGKKRAMPRGCGTIKAPLVKTIRASLTFDGFAVSVGAPNAGATILPGEPTITDPALCRKGGGLYAVFTYKGPRPGVTFDLAIFAGPKTIETHPDLRVGRNAILMASRPKKNGYSFKGQIVPVATGARIVGLSDTSGTATVDPGC